MIRWWRLLWAPLMGSRQWHHLDGMRMRRLRDDGRWEYRLITDDELQRWVEDTAW
jgi:hypothetical protein